MVTTAPLFAPATFRERRARLSREIGSGLVLFLGNDEVGMNYTANVYPFRQDSTFLYFWAVDQPGLAGIDVDSTIFRPATFIERASAIVAARASVVFPERIPPSTSARLQVGGDIPVPYGVGSGD